MDKLVVGLTTTLLGLVIVFVMLFLIIAVIKLIAKALGLVDKAGEKRKEKKAKKAEAKAPQVKAEEKPAVPAEVKAEEPPAEEADDLELIAVIAAACAAMMDTSPANIAVRSVKKVRRTAWANAGRRSQMM